MQNGKGDRRRPCLVSPEVAAQNWDRIFRLKTSMHTYLSIDLDYWNSQPKVRVREFFENLRLLDSPLIVVNDHHKLLGSINRGDCNRLINVDYHSDVSDCPTDLNCGNWANFITWQDMGSFIWRYPSKACLTNRGWGGYCHDRANPFTTNVTQWKSITKKQGVTKLPWSTVTHVGIALSLDWQHDNHLTRFCEDLNEAIKRCSMFADRVLESLKPKRVAA